MNNIIFSEALTLDEATKLLLSSTSQSKTIEETIEQIFTLSPSDKKDLVRKTLKLGEEYGELSEAVLSVDGSHGCSYKNKTREDILEEGADVIIVAFSIMEKAGFTLKDVNEMMDLKTSKWADKIKEEAN